MANVAQPQSDSRSPYVDILPGFTAAWVKARHIAGMRYVSLFSGIGGFELGIQKAFPDAQCVGFSEIEPRAVEVYGRRFPKHRALGDVARVMWDSARDGPVDLIVAGSPCQGNPNLRHFNSRPKADIEHQERERAGGSFSNSSAY